MSNYDPNYNPSKEYVPYNAHHWYGHVEDVAPDNDIFVGILWGILLLLFGIPLMIVFPPIVTIFIILYLCEKEMNKNLHTALKEVRIHITSGNCTSMNTFCKTDEHLVHILNHHGFDIVNKIEDTEKITIHVPGYDVHFRV